MSADSLRPALRLPAALLGTPLAGAHWWQGDGVRAEGRAGPEERL